MTYCSIIKPSIDRLCAFVFLLVGSPVMIGIMILLWLSQRGKVFYFQPRAGLHGAKFVMAKFRTMHEPTADGRQKVTFMGNFIRALSLDELPQFWHVLRGEMSIVGPRPLPMEYLVLMTERQSKRHEVLPGITGWTQVNGRTSIPWEKKFELDAYYVDNISFTLDMRILVKTILLLLSFRKDISLEEQKFSGN